MLNGDPVLSWWGCEILLTRYVPSRDVSQALKFTYFSSKYECMLPEVGDWVDVSSGGMNARHFTSITEAGKAIHCVGYAQK